MPNGSKSFDVAVIGGGVIGLSIAWRALQRGLRTIVLERATPGGGTTHVSAGMLGPIAEADPGEEPLLRLGLAASRDYPDFIAELAERSGLDPGYSRCGTLLLARDGDESEALERELRMRTSLELPVRRLRASAARRLEPALAPTLRLALDVPDDHAVDPRALTAALVAAIKHANGTLLAGTEVIKLVVSEAGVGGVRLRDGELVRAHNVVVAAGPWSSAIDVPAHARVPVRPVKGQILRLRDPAGPGLLTRVVRMTGGYIVPRGDGRYVIGATMEERGFDVTVTAGAVFELLRGATELVPGVAELAIDELSVGHRPGTSDNAPVIGPGAVSGLHWATGHHRNGVLLAPVTAELVVAGILAEPSTAELPDDHWMPFAPGRFASPALGGRR